MNYITSCPECNTQFLISQEHLKAHRGKVQCGHCNHVFNAKNRLTEMIETGEETSFDASEYFTAPEEVSITAPEVATSETTELSSIETTAAAPAPEDTKNIALPAVSPWQIEDLATEPHFASPAKKTSWGLYALCILLALGAAMQSTYFLRNQIAAHSPRVKPILVSACLPLHCKIELPKQLELLLIDDSDMQEDETYQSVINFNSTLINNADFVQAYPNIELTLTNTQDEAVIKTLLKPHQYLGAGINLAEGIAAHQEINIALPLHVQDIAAAGYRVQLTY